MSKIEMPTLQWLEGFPALLPFICAISLCVFSLEKIFKPKVVKLFADCVSEKDDCLQQVRQVVKRGREKKQPACLVDFLETCTQKKLQEWELQQFLDFVKGTSRAEKTMLLESLENVEGGSLKDEAQRLQKRRKKAESNLRVSASKVLQSCKKNILTRIQHEMSRMYSDADKWRDEFIEFFSGPPIDEATIRTFLNKKSESELGVLFSALNKAVICKTSPSSTHNDKPFNDFKKEYGQRNRFKLSLKKQASKMFSSDRTYLVGKMVDERLTQDGVLVEKMDERQIRDDANAFATYIVEHIEKCEEAENHLKRVANVVQAGTRLDTETEYLREWKTYCKAHRGSKKCAILILSSCNYELYQTLNEKLEGAFTRRGVILKRWQQFFATSEDVAADDVEKRLKEEDETGDLYQVLDKVLQRSPTQGLEVTQLFQDAMQENKFVDSDLGQLLLRCRNDFLDQFIKELRQRVTSKAILSASLTIGCFIQAVKTQAVKIEQVDLNNMKKLVDIQSEILHLLFELKHPEERESLIKSINDFAEQTGQKEEVEDILFVADFERASEVIEYSIRLVKQDGSNDEVRHASAGGFDAVVRQASTGGSDAKYLMLPTTTEKAETVPHTSGLDESDLSSTSAINMILWHWWKCFRKLWPCISAISLCILSLEKVARTRLAELFADSISERDDCIELAKKVINKGYYKVQPAKLVDLLTPFTQKELKEWKPQQFPDFVKRTSRAEKTMLLESLENVEGGRLKDEAQKLQKKRKKAESDLQASAGKILSSCEKNILIRIEHKMNEMYSVADKWRDGLIQAFSGPPIDEDFGTFLDKKSESELGVLFSALIEAVTDKASLPSSRNDKPFNDFKREYGQRNHFKLSLEKRASKMFSSDRAYFVEKMMDQGQTRDGANAFATLVEHIEKCEEAEKHLRSVAKVVKAGTQSDDETEYLREWKMYCKAHQSSKENAILILSSCNSELYKTLNEKLEGAFTRRGMILKRWQRFFATSEDVAADDVEKRLKEEDEPGDLYEVLDKVLQQSPTQGLEVTQLLQDAMQENKFVDSHLGELLLRCRNDFLDQFIKELRQLVTCKAILSASLTMGDFVQAMKDQKAKIKHVDLEKLHDLVKTRNDVVKVRFEFKDNEQRERYIKGIRDFAEQTGRLKEVEDILLVFGSEKAPEFIEYVIRLVKQDGSNDEVRHASAGGFDAVVRQASTGGSDAKYLMLPTTTEKAETVPHTSGLDESDLSSISTINMIAWQWWRRFLKLWPCISAISLCIPLLEKVARTRLAELFADSISERDDCIELAKRFINKGYYKVQPAKLVDFLTLFTQKELKEWKPQQFPDFVKRTSSAEKTMLLESLENVEGGSLKDEAQKLQKKRKKAESDLQASAGKILSSCGKDILKGIRHEMSRMYSDADKWRDEFIKFFSGPPIDEATIRTFLNKKSESELGVLFSALNKAVICKTSPSSTHNDEPFNDFKKEYGQRNRFKLSLKKQASKMFSSDRTYLVGKMVDERLTQDGALVEKMDERQIRDDANAFATYIVEHIEKCEEAENHLKRVANVVQAGTRLDTETEYLIEWKTYCKAHRGSKKSAILILSSCNYELYQTLNEKLEGAFTRRGVILKRWRRFFATSEDVAADDVEKRLKEEDEMGDVYQVLDKVLQRSPTQDLEVTQLFQDAMQENKFVDSHLGQLLLRCRNDFLDQFIKELRQLVTCKAILSASLVMGDFLSAIESEKTKIEPVDLEKLRDLVKTRNDIVKVRFEFEHNKQKERFIKGIKDFAEQTGRLKEVEDILRVVGSEKAPEFIEYVIRLVEQDGSDAVVRQASTGDSDVKYVMLPTTTAKAVTVLHTSG
ncbi:uncharacterized protein [Watersipora subatra]|uniref:uncharacterized protein n=1 Tax=Watersipora subatra TaxID=2589382 RepID=UPI00355BD25D